MSGVKLSPKHGVNPSMQVCFYCGETIGIALLGRLPNDKEAPRSAIFDYNPCDKCKENMKLGITVIEAVDSKHSKNPEIQAGISPTGRWLVVKEDILNGFLDKDFVTNVLKYRKTFMDVEAFTKIFGNALDEMAEDKKDGI